MELIKKVDVIINVYGKPWQTLCTLKSLMLHSGDHIDKIYFIEEREQPYGDNVKWIINEFENIIHYTPERYLFTPTTYSFGDVKVPENRYNFRYQYGIEKSDKKYVFVTHNDILYTGDIIGEMISEISDNSGGIGLIGQCWNCPAFKGNVCSGDKIYEYNPRYSDVIDICNRFKPARHTQFIHLINRDLPMPLPECRLNEFACLLNREISVLECPPNSNTPFFGAYDILDLGDAWFRGLWMKGIKFNNYDINRSSIHGYYSQIDSEIRTYNINIKEDKYTESKFFVSGYPTQLNHAKYLNSELVAKEYYENNLRHVK